MIRNKYKRGREARPHLDTAEGGTVSTEVEESRSPAGEQKEILFV